MTTWSRSLQPLSNGHALVWGNPSAVTTAEFASMLLRGCETPANSGHWRPNESGIIWSERSRPKVRIHLPLSRVPGAIGQDIACRRES